MVYESDFYTTRRPYRPSTYSVTRPQVDWEKVPFVPRPSLVPDPVTAFGKRQKAQPRQRVSILDPAARAAIKPKVLLEPIKPYVSARDATRERVLSSVRQHERLVEAGGDPAICTPRDHMDVLLPALHRTRPLRVPHRQVFYSNYATY